MNRAYKFHVLLLLFFSFLAASSSWATFQSKLNISTSEDIGNEFKTVPCQDKDRLSAVKALFEKMGAASSEVTVEKYKGVENVVVSRQGASDEKIVIGAHYDKTFKGCGAIDNWSGIVALAHLYKTLRAYSLKKTILFVAFGKEEVGLVGSRAMVSAISKNAVGQYCAMINIDSFGLGAPQVAHNMSSKKLEELAAKFAKEMKMPFGNASIEGASSDSVSFIAKKIPALTLHGLASDWPSILHSNNDQPSKVIPESVYLGYRLALALAVHIDENPCNAYR